MTATVPGRSRLTRFFVRRSQRAVPDNRFMFGAVEAGRTSATFVALSLLFQYSTKGGVRVKPRPYASADLSLQIGYNSRMPFEFVDTHCHLNHEDFDGDREEVRARAREAGVTRLLCISYDRASSRRAAGLRSDAGVYAAVGIHPESAEEWNEAAAAEMAALYGDGVGRVAAYGEIGLDYHWDTVPRARQQEVFAAQIALARRLSPHPAPDHSQPRGAGRHSGRAARVRDAPRRS